MIDGRVLRERLPRVQTVDRARGRKDQVLDSVVAATLQDVLEAEDVGVDVGVGVFHRVAHAGLRREMHDALWFVLAEKVLDGIGIADVSMDEREGARLSKLVEPRFLEPRVVIRIEVVDADDGLAAVEQPLRSVKANEAGRAGDEDQNVHMLSCAPRWPSMFWSPAGRASSARTLSTRTSSAVGVW